MGRYNEVYQCVWDSKDFQSLSKPRPNAQILWLFLLTGNIRTPLPGIYNVGLGAIQDYLKWSRKALWKAFQELLGKAMVKVDLEKNIIYLPNWFKFNKPSNPNVLKGWLNLLDNIPNCQCKSEYLQQLKALIKDFDKAFRKVWDKHFESLTETPVPYPVPVPDPLPVPEPEKKNVKDFLFNKFWESYPRKENKQNALKSFLKINPDEKLLKEMLFSLEKFKESKQWQDKLYIPLPTTWLNGKRWEDVIDIKLEWTKTDYFASECPDCGGIRYFWVKGKQKKAICDRCQKKEGIKNG